jgi:hypothetical protein
MDKRIRELEYVLSIPDLDIHDYEGTFNIKFAELLIHETARLFDPSEKSELGYRIADRIYKHFDIK